MIRPFSSAPSLLALTVSIGLASCAVSDPTQFHALSRQTPPRSPTASASIATTGMDATSIGGVGVEPVIVPGHALADPGQ